VSVCLSVCLCVCLCVTLPLHIFRWEILCPKSGLHILLLLNLNTWCVCVRHASTTHLPPPVTTKNRPRKESRFHYTSSATCYNQKQALQGITLPLHIFRQLLQPKTGLARNHASTTHLPPPVTTKNRPCKKSRFHYASSATCYNQKQASQGITLPLHIFRHLLQTKTGLAGILIKKSSILSFFVEFFNCEAKRTGYN
jgi:hypothetical protein